jgi:hypothetical protein
MLAWWHTPVIPVMQEAEGSWSEASLVQKHETLPEK